MSKAAAWLLAGLLVVCAMTAVWLRPVRSPDSSGAASAISPDSSQLVSGDDTETDMRLPESDALQLAELESLPDDRRMPPLGDSDETQKQVFAMTIRDAGYPCPAVLSAQPLSHEGNSWRAYCGSLLLYWIDRDEIGRMSVEPGVYDDTRPESGGRMLTIPAEEFQQLQLQESR